MAADQRESQLVEGRPSLSRCVASGSESARRLAVPKRVLIVDDEENLRNDAFGLEAVGYEVGEAGTD